MNNINLNLLKYFYEVVNEKNITKASEKLMISQPAITKAIKELENQLNVKLFNRSKKGVIPTNAGIVLYEHTKEILEKIDSTLNIIELDNNRKHLYIGATTTNFMIFLKYALEKFREKYKDVHISILLEDLNTLNDLARLGKLDLIIVNSYEKIKKFKTIKTFEITDKFVVAKKYYPELGKGKYSLHDLLSYPTVLLSNITHGRKNFNNYLKSLNIEYKPTYEFNSYSLCRELIKEGFGIGIGNPIHYQADDFIIIDTDFNLPSRKFNICYNILSKNELVNKFIQYIIICYYNY